MNGTIILDLEGNGLREDITQIHCIVAKCLDTGDFWRFYNLAEVYYQVEPFTDLDFVSAKRIVESYDTIVGHNIIGYDIPVMQKLLGIDFSRMKTFDTLVASILLNPDRQLPIGCPVSVINPVTGNKDKVGPHSLEAHGFRLGLAKVHHYDWQVFSKEMLERCYSDVLITEKLYLEQREIIKNV